MFQLYMLNPRCRFVGTLKPHFFHVSCDPHPRPARIFGQGSFAPCHPPRSEFRQSPAPGAAPGAAPLKMGNSTSKVMGI